MLVADTYLGHRDDPDIAERLADASDEATTRVTLSDTDRRRSRVRTETVEGRDLGIVVGRELENGDVLATEEGTLVVVELATVDALVLDFAAADVSPLTALELGHALGNRHWDLAIRDGAALFPVQDSRERMTTQLGDQLPRGVETRFEAVPPTTFDDGTGPHDHSHDDHSSHDHSHDDHSSHDHSHDHDHSGGIHLAGGGDS